MNHPPVSDYLYFAAGSSGSKLLKNYPSFNGHIANVKLNLGPGGYIDTLDELKKVLPKIPQVPELPVVKKTILEAAKDFKRDDAKVEPTEFPTEFNGA